MSLLPDTLQRAAAVVADRLGLSFPERRFPDLQRGLVRVCGDASAEAVTRYVERLEGLADDHDEWRRMARSLTVGETCFFRDPASFEILEHEVLRPLIASRRAAGTLRLRLWSAACASGEEPYSLAILLNRLLPDRADWNVMILGTDIDTSALERARTALYTPWSLRRAPEWVRERHFLRRGPDCFALDPQVRAMVRVAELNLASDVYPSVATNTTAMDVILCRNVLMYLTLDAQRATVRRLGQCLRTGGWLAVAPAEASPRQMFEPLVPISFPRALLFRRDPTAAAPPPSPKPIGTAPTVDSGPLPEPPARVSADPRPEEAGSLLEEARALADRGALEEARALCEAALTRDPLETEARILLALVHQERADSPAALEALRAAIYLTPDSAPAHFLMGCALCAAGRCAEGRRALEAAVELLGSLPDDTVLEQWEGLTAGRLRATARQYAEPR